MNRRYLDSRLAGREVRKGHRRRPYLLPTPLRGRVECTNSIRIRDGSSPMVPSGWDRGRSMLLAAVYAYRRVMLVLLLIRLRPAQEAEILLFRHQVRVLERATQVRALASAREAGPSFGLHGWDRLPRTDEGERAEVRRGRLLLRRARSFLPLG